MNFLDLCLLCIYLILCYSGVGYLTIFFVDWLFDYITQSGEVIIEYLSDRILHPKADNDAGYDIHISEDVMILPSIMYEESKLIQTEVSFIIPSGYFGIFKERSSAGKLGIILAGGIIDAGYSKKLTLIVTNFSGKTLRFKRGHRIGQIVLIKQVNSRLKKLSSLKNSKNIIRGDNGFGSTGLYTE